MKKLLLWLIPFSFCLSAYGSQDIKRIDSRAVMPAIYMLLLDEPSPSEVEIVPAQFLQGGYPVNGEFTIYFSRPSSDVYLCFFVSGFSGLGNGRLSIELNGVERSVQSGENCFFIQRDGLLEENRLVFLPQSPELQITLSQIGLEASREFSLGMRSLTRANWTESSVRKVLRIFAFGGHASESQITVWANMRPKRAIRQMLNFSRHNLLLSPLARGEKYSEPATQYGTLRGFADNYLGSAASYLPIPVEQRNRFRVDAVSNDNSLGDSLSRMMTTRGLNPFRHRIGLWETNYHLSVNLAKSAVTKDQVVRLYDSLMATHEAGLPYQRVMAVAAKSAAVAAQYGHHRNRWGSDGCSCNEDFSREISQLYFGIFGLDDPDYHENVSVPNAAKMLTGVPFSDNGDTIRFTSENHHIGSLEILEQIISGANAAEKIDQFVDVAIEHPESLDNLPIMIISGLADDNLGETKKRILRSAWRSMGEEKSFLDFIQAYAISYIFHEDNFEQYKYFNSFERAIYMANRLNLDNLESLTAGGSNSVSGNFNLGRAGFNVAGVLRNDNAILFYPSHNVFGGQISQEAINSTKVFEYNYNRSTEFLETFTNFVRCEECDLGEHWVKDWSSVIPKTNGKYQIDDIARWLWTYIVGNTTDYGQFERAHLFTKLGAVSDEPGTYRVFDFAQLLCIREERIAAGVTNNTLSDLVSREAWGNYCAYDGGYSADEIRLLNKTYTPQDFTPEINRLLNQIKVLELPIDSDNPTLRFRANQRVQEAIAFIFSTPYIFADEAIQ